MIRELAYGEFLLRSESGEARHLNANLDSTFTEVDQLIGNDSRASTLDQFKRADLLNDVFGVACDKDQHGNEFRIGLKALCTHCNRRNVIEWESVEPPKYIELDIASVTHETWSSFTVEEKQARVSAALDASSLV